MVTVPPFCVLFYWIYIENTLTLMIKGNILVAIFSFYIVTTMQSQGLTRPRTWENSGITIEFQCLLYFGCDLNEYMHTIPKIYPTKRK